MRTWIILSGSVAALAACSAGPEADSAAADGNAMPMSEMPMSEMPMGAMEDQTMTMKPSEGAMQAKREAAAMLVDRFGAEACRKVDMLGRVRKTDPDGVQTVLRAFAAPNACADAIQSSVRTLGFAEVEPGLFALGTEGGASERVFVQIEKDGTGAVVEWEAQGK